MPMPMPIPISPAASPRRCGGSAEAATRGDGIQIAAPPRPISTSAPARAGPFPATDASSSPVVDRHSPMRISQTSVIRFDTVATITVPRR